MNKAELIAVLAEKVTLTKKDVEDVVDKLFDTMTETLASGEKVVISGFGTFEVRRRVSRTGRNPRNGDDIAIPAQNTPAFRTGKGLKDAVR